MFPQNSDISKRTSDFPSRTKIPRAASHFGFADAVGPRKKNSHGTQRDLGRSAAADGASEAVMACPG